MAEYKVGKKGKSTSYAINITEGTSSTVKTLEKKKKAKYWVEVEWWKYNYKWGVWLVSSNGRWSHNPIYAYHEKRTANQQAKRLSQSLGIEFRK